MWRIFIRSFENPVGWAPVSTEENCFWMFIFHRNTDINGLIIAPCSLRGGLCCCENRESDTGDDYSSHPALFCEKHSLFVLVNCAGGVCESRECPEEAAALCLIQVLMQVFH